MLDSALQSELASLLADLDSAAVECDGSTRLHRAGIDYTPFEGSFEFKGRWCTLTSGLRSVTW